MTSTPTPPRPATPITALLTEHGWTKVTGHTYTENRPGVRFHVHHLSAHRNDMFIILEWKAQQDADGALFGSWGFTGATLMGPPEDDPDSFSWERRLLHEARELITSDADSQRATWREYVTVETARRTEKGTRVYAEWEPYNPAEADDDVADVEFTCRLRKHGDRWTSWVTLTPAPDHECAYPESLRRGIGGHHHYRLWLYTYVNPRADISPLMRYDLGVECDLLAAEDNVAEHLEFYAFWPTSDGDWEQVLA